MTKRNGFYEKVEKDGNFCGMTKVTFERIEQYIEFIKEYPSMSPLPEATARHLIQEKDQKIKAEVIEILFKQMYSPDIATSGRVIKRANSRGGKRKTIRLKNADILSMKDKNCIVNRFVSWMFASGVGYKEIDDRIKIAFVKAQKRFIKREGTW